MVRSIQRIHQTSKPQCRRSGEQGLPQVLRGLEILKVLDEELGGRQVLHHAFHLLLLVVAQDNDLVYLEDCRSFGYLARQVGLQLHRLRIVYDGRGHHHRHRKVPYSIVIVVVLLIKLVISNKRLN